MQGGWRAVAGWALAGALVAFAVVAMWTIGWLVMPFAVWASYSASKRSPGWRDITPGILLGAGAVILIIAFMHLDYVPCPKHLHVIATEDDRFRSHRCGGLDPMPWFRVGAVTVASGIMVYALSQYWTRRRTIL